MSTTHSVSKFLVVGQGLAGTLLTHFLTQAGQQVTLIDQDHAHSASIAAAGLINPITGRRFVKSWRVDELIPFAQATYQELEEQLGQTFFHPRGLLRALSSVREENDWLARSAEPGYSQYIQEPIDLGTYQMHTQAAFGYGEVRQSAQVAVPVLLKAYQKYALDKGMLRLELFDYQLLKPSESGVFYGDVFFDQVVFCEGQGAIKNPFFNYLPFRGDKGEALIVHIPNAGFSKILKNNIFIAPLGNERYWVGATYEPHYENDLPSAKGRHYLEQKLQELLTIPYEIVDHWAAVRPTVKDRRPFLGIHPEFPQLAVFNGLGTKGASLAPFWANHFVQVLQKKLNLDPEVNIDRFAKQG